MANHVLCSCAPTHTVHPHTNTQTLTHTHTQHTCKHTEHPPEGLQGTEARASLMA
jgi:hypothetical protein